MGPRTLVSPGNDAADELTRRVALLVPFVIPHSLYPLICRIHSSFFSDWRRTFLSKFFDTHAPSISTKKLVLPRQALCIFSRLRCNGHSLLLSSYLSRSGRIENPSCSTSRHPSQYTSHLILTVQPWTISAADSLATTCLSTTFGPDPGELPGFWYSMVFRHTPFLGRDRVTTTTTTYFKSHVKVSMVKNTLQMLQEVLKLMSLLQIFARKLAIHLNTAKI